MKTQRHLSAILFALLALPASAQQVKHEPKTLAVVIGISKYQKLGGGQQLQFAARDATSFVEAIQKRGVNPQDIKLLTGSDATAFAIKSAVGNWLARSASEADTVLIFFSGHGFCEREFGEAYLLAYDSDPADPYGSAFSISELNQALSRRVRSGRVVVIADAVRHDFFDPEADASSATAFERAFDQLAASRPGVSAIIASGPGEFSREGQRWGGRGVFTKHLADVLFDGAEKNGNLASTFGELFDLLKGRVSDDTAGKQHPWRTGTAVAQTDAVRAERQNPPSLTNESIAKSAPANVSAPSRLVEGTKPSDVRTQSPSQKTVANPSSASNPSSKEAADRKTSREAVSQSKPAQPLATGEKTPPASTGAKPGATSSTATAQQKSVSSVSNPTGSGSIPGAGSKPAIAAGPTSSPSPSVKPPAKGGATPPSTEPVRGAQTTGTPPREIARQEVAVAGISAAPRPTVALPSTGAVSSDRATNRSETIATSIPATRAEAAPSPLIMQLETAIASKNLIEPRNGSAWDLYQQMASDPGTAPDAARLRPRLTAALVAQGRIIVSGDVRVDNISEKVDEFKRAGQMLARARTLTPENGDVGSLEKLSAAEALIALQFYDEAERALTLLQTAKLAAVENALGLVYQGKLDAFRAERAFKRAIELDSKWGAPHYNLALLYRSQQNQASLTELEAAATLDPINVNMMAALGEEYFTRQQWKQATETFRKAVALKPADDNLHTKLGHALYSLGQQDEANREYQKAQQLRGKRP